MKNTTLITGFIFAASLFVGFQVARAESIYTIRNKANVEAQVKKKVESKIKSKVEVQLGNKKLNNKLGKWHRAKASHIQSKGLSVADANTCERFEIEVLEDNIIYKLRCGRHFSSALLPLNNEKEYKVEKSNNEITITKLSYYGQKIQTSRMNQSLVKIPFVEEVIHVKFLTDGSLSFYKEDFLVDDFGRVVQKSFLQGFGLSSKDVKIGRTDSKQKKGS